MKKFLYGKESSWCPINLPKEVLIESRMYLNRKQAKELAKKLNYFSKKGRLREE